MRSRRIWLGILISSVLVVWFNYSWAGGNLQFRDPSNPSEIINQLWDDRMLPITWVLCEDGLPGSGIDNSTLIAEVTAAFDTWEALATSKLDFEFGGEVPVRQGGLGGPLGPGIDGHNLVTFTDPNIIFPPGYLAFAIIFSFSEETVITDANNDLDGDGTPDIPNGTYPAGTIFDADMVFNSSEPWSISGANNTYDIRAVALHEIGHVVGLCHSCIRDAVMWPFLASDISLARTLKQDDIAYVSSFYPNEPAYSNTFGAIGGVIINGFNSAPVLGAHVFAVDPQTGGSKVGGYSGDDGSYLLPGLASGNYLVAIEPLDGDPVGLDPFRINEVVHYTFDTSFPEEFYDANESDVEAYPMAALQVAVSAGVDTAGIDLVTNTVDVPGVNLILEQGYNLISYPVEVPSGLRMFDLLQALGDTAAEFIAIDRFVSGTSTFERAEYVDGNLGGVNFPLRRAEGYVVHMAEQEVVTFSGSTDCPDLDLVRGLNLVGIPCPPAGYTAFDLIEDIGSPYEIDKVERFDPETETFQVADYDASGVPSGDDFPISNGEGYLIYMLADKAGVKIPAVGRSFAPVITGLSPGRGVPGTVVVIFGEGFDPDVTKNTVIFNGVGAGIIFATSTSLTVTVPGGATTGLVRVVVAGRYSNGVEFVVEDPVVTEEEANGTDLVSGQSVQGTLTAEAEQDRYQFTALAGSLVTISAESVTPGVPDLVLVLENPYGAVVATDDNSGGGTDPRINNFELQTTGMYTVVVSNVPGSGFGDYRLSITITTRTAPPRVSILGGDFQTGLAGSTLPIPLSVLVNSATGAPLAGAPVTFVATDATITGSTINPTNAGTVILDTNASGIVTVETTLSATPGTYTITVTVAGMSPVQFTVGATSKAITSITMNGDQQQGIVGQALPNPLEIILKDSTNNPVANAVVGFLVAGGGGSLGSPGAQSTGVDGKASTTLTLGKKISDPQLVAAFVPLQQKPLLFEAFPKADTPNKIHSNKSHFNRMSLGSVLLNALYVEVFDQYDNPVEGATIDYTAPGSGLSIYPGLGPGGVYFTDFKTNADGLHVAMVSTPASVIPTIDEFATKGDPNLASMYTITATVNGTALSQTYKVDVDMGPHMVTYSTQNDSALIAQVLTNPVKKEVYRYERHDVNGNGDFRDDDFTVKVKKPMGGLTVNLEVRREDGNKETDFGLQPTQTAAPSAVTDSSGIATVDITMGDVGGVNHVVGTIESITVSWVFPNDVVTIVFVDSEKFGESTNLIAIPVIVTATIKDAESGIDFATVRASLNGTEFFTAPLPPAVFPTFPEKLEVIAGGTTLKTLNLDMVLDSVFSEITINYHPSAPKLNTGSNQVEVRKVKDLAGNEQSISTTQTFTFP